MLNFPNAPQPGTTYNNGGATWLWDGSKWTTSAAGNNDVVNSASVGNTGRNLVHNGRFEVQQRGMGPWTAANTYTADRWKMDVVLDSASVGLSVGPWQAIGDESAVSSIGNTFTGNAGASAFNLIKQNIEGVRRLSGKTVTVSFYAAATAAGVKLGVSLSQIFGTGGSPSASINLNGQSVTLTNAWGPRYSLTFTLPSVIGKTLGTNGDDSTQLNFWFSCGATNAAIAGNVGVQSGSISIWGVQLEVGSVATPLDYGGSPADQLQRCQRFYCTGQFNIVATPAAAGNYVGGTYAFPVAMRATPTVAIGAAVGADNNISAFTVDTVVATGFRFSGTAGSSGQSIGGRNFTASADL